MIEQMRKILLLLCALLTGVSGVWADDVSFDSNKYYYIVEASTGRYAAFGVTGAEGQVGLQPEGQKGDRFVFTKVSEGVFSIKNTDGKQFGATHSWNTTNDATDWTITLSEGKYTLQSGKGYLNYQSAHSQSLYTNGNATSTKDFYIIEGLLPINKYVNVSGTKANTFTASSGGTNYWYVMTQTRNGESPMYDVGLNQVIKRAASGTAVSGSTLDSEKYLVRFVATGTGSSYYVQFATGNYVYANNPTSNGDIKTTDAEATATKFMVYNIDNQDTHIGLNVTTNGTDNYGKRLDNNGAGNTVALWDDDSNYGVITSTGGNNDWAIYPVELVDDVEIAFTLTDQNGATYDGTYRTAWYGDGTATPTLSGAAGATFTNTVFAEDMGTYSMTANITFEFPVSSNATNNPTTIRSKLGNSLWYATADGKVKANNEANTHVYDTNADYYRWYIMPIFNDGIFYFALYNVGAKKYIPSEVSTASDTECILTDNTVNAGAYCYSSYKQGNGFNQGPESTNFLSINSNSIGQNIFLWTGGNATASHTGSAMSFPELVTIDIDDAFAKLKNAKKFDILNGSTVRGPSEFAAPAEINAAIDAAQEVEDTDEAKIAFIESTNGAKIQNYLKQVATYGALATIQITMNQEYGTMILPCPCSRIDGLDIYSCSEQVDDVLTLTLVDGDYSQDVPYIIHAVEGSKYTIIGWNKGSTATHTSGWLTGVLNPETDIPSGSYMLATNKSTGVQAFYQVSGPGVKCAINKCYLTVPSAGVKAFFFDENGKATSIDEIFGGESEQGNIYNLAGQRLTKAQKGINIINGKKIIK